MHKLNRNITNVRPETTEQQKIASLSNNKYMNVSRFENQHVGEVNIIIVDIYDGTCIRLSL